MKTPKRYNLEDIGKEFDSLVQATLDGKEQFSKISAEEQKYVMNGVIARKFYGEKGFGEEVYRVNKAAFYVSKKINSPMGKLKFILTR